jgi:hypothetical protein
MPNFIIKLTEKETKKDFYFKWSTIVDSAVSAVLTFEEAKAHLASIFSGEELKEVLINLETKGTSTPFYSLRECLDTNADGCRSYKDMIKLYANG